MVLPEVQAKTNATSKATKGYILKGIQGYHIKSGREAHIKSNKA